MSESMNATDGRFPERVRLRRSAPLLATLALISLGCSDRDSEDVATDVKPIASPVVPSEISDVAANEAVLTWDAVTHPGVRGYRIYYGPKSRTYLQLPGQGIEVGNVTSYSIQGLVRGRRYYFSVTTLGALDSESEYSNEVFKDIR